MKEIQAASIIAKVWRDELMQTYALIDPNLGLESNQGYGTRKHQEAIENISYISEFHRKKLCALLHDNSIKNQNFFFMSVVDPMQPCISNYGSQERIRSSLLLVRPQYSPKIRIR
ncbi:hypothetical protein H6769_03010 [Candidatus Peribacteria bacterium]|nr:hypothetical protein [Candidatus Peribacteria bacterium]